MEILGPQGGLAYSDPIDVSGLDECEVGVAVDPPLAFEEILEIQETVDGKHWVSCPRHRGGDFTLSLLFPAAPGRKFVRVAMGIRNAGLPPRRVRCWIRPRAPKPREEREEGTA